MRARIALPDPARLDAAQAEAYRSILATRGNVAGPFLAWMFNPELASLAEKLGAFCRYGTTLSQEESELLILLVAAHYQSDGEWNIHAPIALAAGLSEAVVQAVQLGRTPTFRTLRLTLLHSLTDQLLRTNRIEDDLFTAALSQFGCQTMAEITGILGYYAFVAFTLNAFAMNLEGAPDVFEPGHGRPWTPPAD